MTSNLTKKTTLFLACLLLCGCETLQGYSSVKPVPTEPDLVGLRLAQAAEKAAGALDEIAGIEQQRAPAMPPTDDYSNAPPALMQVITVKWAGPIEQMLQTLATRAGLRLETKGNRPGVPLMVNVNVYQKPMIEVLRDMGLQAGRRADITVNSSLGVIEIRYAPVDRT